MTLGGPVISAPCWFRSWSQEDQPRCGDWQGNEGDSPAQPGRKPRSLPFAFAAVVVGLSSTAAAEVVVVSEIVNAMDGNWSFDPIGLLEPSPS